MCRLRKKPPARRSSAKAFFVLSHLIEKVPRERGKMERVVVQVGVAVVLDLVEEDGLDSEAEKTDHNNNVQPD